MEGLSGLNSSYTSYVPHQSIEGSNAGGTYHYRVMHGCMHLFNKSVFAYYGHERSLLRERRRLLCV